jgi:hypothetical protein
MANERGGAGDAGQRPFVRLQWNGAVIHIEYAGHAYHYRFDSGGRSAGELFRQPPQVNSVEKAETVSLLEKGGIVYLLIHFEGPSRGPESAMHYCGAGQEEALALFAFSPTGEAKPPEFVLTRSCWVTIIDPDPGFHSPIDAHMVGELSYFAPGDDAGSSPTVDVHVAFDPDHPEAGLTFARRCRSEDGKSAVVCPGGSGAEPGGAASTTASLELPPERDTSGCNLSVFGGTDRRAFDRFDARLRTAARSEDPSAFVDLVMYPLKVNRDNRTIVIRSREELARDSRIFTTSVRSAIKDQEGFCCRDIGLMYGAGTVWVDVVPAASGKPERYGVSTVNVPEFDPARAPSRTAPETKLKCVAPANTVVVEDLGGPLRYRSWRKGQPMTARPDLVLEGGTVTFDGSGVCEHATYTFKNGDTTYEVSELGCTDGSEPAGTTGRLAVSRGDTALADWFCRGGGD